MSFSVIKNKLRYILCKGIVETKLNLNEIINSLETSIFNNVFTYSFNLDNHTHYKTIRDRFVIR